MCKYKQCAAGVILMTQLHIVGCGYEFLSVRNKVVHWIVYPDDACLGDNLGPYFLAFHFQAYIQSCSQVVCS